jgi:hypothetical protein
MPVVRGDSILRTGPSRELRSPGQRIAARPQGGRTASQSGAAAPGELPASVGRWTLRELQSF